MAKVMKKMYYPKPAEKRVGTSYNEGESYEDMPVGHKADVLAPDENAFAGKLKIRRKEYEKGNPNSAIFRKKKGA